MSRTVSIAFAAALLALLSMPRAALAAAGMPCVTTSNCGSNETCEGMICEDTRRKRKTVVPPPPEPLPSCDCKIEPENVRVQSFRVKNYDGGKASYTVEVCHSPQLQVCQCTKNGLPYSKAPVKLSPPMPVHVGIYHHEAPPQPKCKQVPDLTYFMGMMHGGCAAYSTGTALVTRPTGPTPAWAFAEYGCAFPEVNETDNRAVEIPDLRVRTGRVTTGIRPGTTSLGVRVPVELCNRGGAMTSSALMGLIWGQPTTAPAKPPSGTPFNAFKFSGKALPTLACQHSVWWFPSSGVPQWGSFAGWVVADPKASVKDSDRSNNASRFTYTVSRVISKTR